MKKNKLNLKELTVSSFVTSIGEKDKKTIDGGSSPICIIETIGISIEIYEWLHVPEAGGSTDVGTCPQAGCHQSKNWLCPLPAHSIGDGACNSMPMCEA